MEENKDMLSMNEQLVDMQNQLISQMVDKAKLKIKIDEMSERSDYYENLYNQAKRDLYELELKYTTMKDKVLDSTDENIDDISTKKLIKLFMRKIKNKVKGGR